MQPAHDDLVLSKAYFEELIGCVVGCGCWEDGWDKEETVRAFARGGFSSWGEGPRPTPSLVLEALDRCCEHVSDENLGDTQPAIELVFTSAEDFRSFFAESRRVLRDELAAMT